MYQQAFTSPVYGTGSSIDDMLHRQDKPIFGFNVKLLSIETYELCVISDVTFEFPGRDFPPALLELVEGTMAVGVPESEP